jgi:hypothetical protein
MKTPNSADLQRDRFIETALSRGSDGDDAAFNDKLVVIARQNAKADLEPATTEKLDAKKPHL